MEEPQANIKRLPLDKDLIGRLVKPIISSYINNICMIIGERHDFQLTVGTYGGATSKYLSSITYFTFKKGEVNNLPYKAELLNLFQEIIKIVTCI